MATEKVKDYFRQFGMNCRIQEFEGSSETVELALYWLLMSAELLMTTALLKPTYILFYGRKHLSIHTL